jgi:thioester reductase-like protein
MNDLSDILPLVLKACVLLEKCPVLDIEVTMVPVDYVTSAMVHLAGRADSFDRAFHYFHPNPVPWNRLMAIIRNLGYPLEELSYTDWRRALKKRATEPNDTRDHKTFFANAFLAIVAPHFLFYHRPPLDAANLEAGLRGTGIIYPEIDEALMGVYFDYWQKVGFVPNPPLAR